MTPMQITKTREQILEQTSVVDRKQKEPQPYYIEPEAPSLAADPVVAYMSTEQLQKSINKTRKEMEKAAKELDFIKAAQLRDEMFALEAQLKADLKG